MKTSIIKNSRADPISKRRRRIVSSAAKQGTDLFIALIINKF